MCEEILQTGDSAKCSISMRSRSWIVDGRHRKYWPNQHSYQDKMRFLEEHTFSYTQTLPNHILSAWPRLSTCLSVCLFRSFQCIPLQPPSDGLKPCLFIWTQFEDHSFRLYQANWLNKMADRLVRVLWWFTSTMCVTPCHQTVVAWCPILCSSRLSFRSWVLTRWSVS